MNKKMIAMLVAPVIMAGCMTNNMSENTGSTQSAAKLEVSAKNLQHHNWELTHIDGKPIRLPEDFSAPNLEIGESFTANGHAGCNRYFGQGELNGDKFRIDKMASTMMMCPQEAMDLETVMTAVLGEWSTMTLTKQQLKLKNAKHELTFKLRDWVN